MRCTPLCAAVMHPGTPQLRHVVWTERSGGNRLFGGHMAGTGMLLIDRTPDRRGVMRHGESSRGHGRSLLRRAVPA